MLNIEDSLNRLKKSKFRASFHLKKQDIDYINSKGFETIRTHCFDFISQRLAPETILNDGKQTPTHGHPVFPAQHACACCCRGCLSKWHKIKPNRKLTIEQINDIVNLLMAWILNEYNNFNANPKIQKEKTNKKSAQLNFNFID